MSLILAQSGRDNNFNLIRFMAALGVIASHSVLLSTGNGKIEPLRHSTGYALGDLSVNIFFILSGFLIVKSLLTRRDIIAYTAARIVRIIPALFIAAVFCALVIGPMMTSYPLSEYFKATSVWLYPVKIGSVVIDPLTAQLPGVFTKAPFPDTINGPLWTIRYEVLAYVVLLLLALAGALSTQRRFAILFAGAIAGLVIWQTLDPFHPDPTGLDQIIRLGFSFLLGVAAYIFRDRFSLSIVTVLCLLALTWLLAGTTYYRGALYISTAAAVLWFAQTPGGFIRQFNKLGDYSYGLYIFGWPVAQAIIVLNPGMSAIMLFATGAPITLALAIASWHFIEKPALDRRKGFASIIDNIVPDIALYRALKSRLRNTVTGLNSPA